MSVRKTKKRRLSLDAKILWELYQKQPQTFDELLKATSGSRSSVYDVLRFLRLSRILRETKKEVKEEIKKAYAYSDYIGLEEIFESWKGKHVEVSIYDLASRVGKPPDEIEKDAYRLAKKYGFTITPDKTIIARKLKDVFKSR